MVERVLFFVGFTRGVEGPVSGSVLYDIGPVVRSCFAVIYYEGVGGVFVCPQARAAGGILSSFLPFSSLGWGVEERATKHITRDLSTPSSMGELQRHPGIAFGRQHLLFTLSALGWQGPRTTQFLPDTLFSGFRGFHSAVRITPGKPSSSSESLPCTLTWQTTRTPGPGWGRHRQGSNILRSSLYLILLDIPPHHAIWPLQKTMMGSCDSQTLFMYPVRQVKNRIPPAERS